jgi:hypothetical protein
MLEFTQSGKSQTKNTEKLAEIFVEMERRKLDGSRKRNGFVDFECISRTRSSPTPGESKPEKGTDELCEVKLADISTEVEKPKVELSGKRKARKSRKRGTAGKVRRVRRASSTLRVSLNPGPHLPLAS